MRQQYNISNKGQTHTLTDHNLCIYARVDLQTRCWGSWAFVPALHLKQMWPSSSSSSIHSCSSCCCCCGNSSLCSLWCVRACMCAVSPQTACSPGWRWMGGRTWVGGRVLHTRTYIRTRARAHTLENRLEKYKTKGFNPCALKTKLPRHYPRFPGSEGRVGQGLACLPAWGRPPSAATNCQTLWGNELRKSDAITWNV